MIRKSCFPGLILAEQTGVSAVSALCDGGFRLLLLFDTPDEAEKALLGQRSCDYGEAALVARNPGTPPDDLPPHCAWAVAFTDELFDNGCEAEKRGGECNRFSYRAAEALHLSAAERRILTSCFEDLRRESDRKSDCYCKCILTRHVSRLLEYVARFYDRQFITRELENRQLLADYRNFLNRYLSEGRVPLFGIPTAALCADRLQLSESYFADLLLFETGRTHESFFRMMQFDAARRLLLYTRKSVSGIAAELGYTSVCRFNRLFRKLSGLSPEAFRSQGSNKKAGYRTRP